MNDTPTTSAGYGQQDPSTSTDEFNVISFIVSQMMGQMATMRLVQVKAVHSDGEVAAAGTVDVLPLVNQIDGAGNSTPHGTVYGIPWQRLQGGRNAVICDPQVDDIGYVDVSDRDISSVKASRKQSNPGSYRKFDLADGVYVGGCLNQAPTQYILFTNDKIKMVQKDGNSVLLDEGGITVTDKSGNVVLLDTSGIALNDKSGNSVHLTASGVAIADFSGNTVALDASGIVLTDKFGHVISMNSGAINLTGTVAITGDLVLTGFIVAVGPITGAGHSLSTHVHTSGSVGSPTGPPIG